MPDNPRIRVSPGIAGSVARSHDPRTIAVTARSQSPLAWLRLRCSVRRRRWIARSAIQLSAWTEHRTYNADIARGLLARTVELPSSKRALILMLTEYRHALADLAAARPQASSGIAWS